MKTLTESVADLVDQGRSSREIADELGADFSVVSQLAYRARRRSGLIRIGSSTLKSLRGPAKARGIGVTELARRLLQVIGDDGLVASILDDGVVDQPSKPKTTKGKPCLKPNQPSP